MFQYFARIQALLDKVEKEELQSINKAIEAFSEAIINKKAIFSFGASHAGIVTQELYYRAGGLININPIFGKEVLLDNQPITQTSKMERLVGYGTALAEKTPFKPGDVLLVHSVSGRNPVTIEMAIEAKRKGVKIIGITNLTYSKTVSSRHPKGYNLYHYCDVVINNHGDIGDAMIDIDGYEQKVAPSSTVVAVTLVNTIVSEAVKKNVNKGSMPPPILFSANLDGGDERNRQLFEYYKETIHYEF